MIAVYKPLGMTPLETIRQLVKQKPELGEETISYAGRLDPMAEGLLLLLVGDENKQRKIYEAMPKTYEFEVLLGASTDTYDLLGKLVKPKSYTDSFTPPEIASLLPSFVGTMTQPYPPFSSKPVQGKPLYWWARAGRLDEIAIPSREVTITSLSILSETSLSPAELMATIQERIAKVSGDFRQPEILATWQAFLDSPSLPHFKLFRMRITCSSGTYVRSIAHIVGERLRTGTIAYSIKRTTVGSIILEDTIKINL